MIEICDNSKNLYRRIQLAKEELKHTKNPDEKIALCNYIENVYDAISLTDDRNLCIGKKDVFGSFKYYKKFIKKMNIYEDEVTDNFLLNKSYIKGYVGKLVLDIENENLDGIDNNVDVFEVLSLDDYNDIFFQFMQSINLDSFFEKFLKDGNIYNYKIKEGNALGSTLFNPINGNTDILIGDFVPDIQSLFTLAHEMGHVYDLNYFNKDSKSFNRFFYQSFYGEVCPRLFERLFLNYMINNNILKEDAKEKMLDSLYDNYNYLMSCYILSVLDDSFIKELNCSVIDVDSFYNLIKRYFKPLIKDFILEIKYMDLQEDYTYAFGDIVSMFLLDSINKYGFSNDLVNEFINERDKMFRKDFLEDNGLSSNNYMELYKKELKLLKK